MSQPERKLGKMKSVFKHFFINMPYLENLSLLYFKHYLLEACVPQNASVRAC